MVTVMQIEIILSAAMISQTAISTAIRYVMMRSSGMELVTRTAT